MNEETLIAILAATFRGTNSEVLQATNALSSCFTDQNFPNLLFSIIKKNEISFSIRQSAVIQLIRIIILKIIPNDALLSFYLNIGEIIENSPPELYAILRRCSNKLLFLTPLQDPVGVILELFKNNKIKASLFFANSLMKIINTPDQKTLPIYNAFTSHYILLLTQIINENLHSDLFSLIFHFMSRSTTNMLPQILLDQDNLNFWMPQSMKNHINNNLFHYLRFLSNLPTFSTKIHLPHDILELTLYILSNTNDKNCSAMAIKVIYKMISFHLIQFDENTFTNILTNIILPNFAGDNLIEDNHPSQTSCWKDPHDASYFLFQLLINQNNQFTICFYSLFQSIDNDFEKFVCLLDLFSFMTKEFYSINNEHVLSFLQNLVPCFSSEVPDVRAAALKVFSKCNFIFPPEFLCHVICFALANLTDDDSQVRYFSALASSTLINQINDESVITYIYSNTPILTKMNELIMIFIELEKEFQTQMMAASIKKIILFFGKKIQPIIFSIAKEVIELFYYFAASKENGEPSVLLASTINILIEVSEGNPPFVIMLLQALLNSQFLSQIQYPMAFDSIFEILETLLYHSTSFIPEFLQIIPFLYEYLNDNKRFSYFADISPVLEILIWKHHSYFDENILKVILDPLLEYLQNCQKPNEWATAAYIFTKINITTNMNLPQTMNLVYPKMIQIMATSSGYEMEVFYRLIEYFFSYHFTQIVPDHFEILFNIYLEYAQFPSFIDSLIKSFNFIPDNLKITAILSGIATISNHYGENNEYDDLPEYGYDNENEETMITAKWYDEKELLMHFLALCSRIINETGDFPGKEKLIQFVASYTSNNT
ncbi:hypothetical protein TRFO_37477 [Tritrichomonas foetus]|uniref:Importin N-terminal domain-containing protein n=1 Tax=Tritrichomonas foetus TaxID=1144522 RepID=A0A1J4JCK1_9EUKA|nr:hypothetical protein TRFO_37477 [Tritrichomonas foetus]|eukprot:OHS96401.1 hypothetical protein TRFO_37477 [Tritrichomonas foetus]